MARKSTTAVTVENLETLGAKRLAEILLSSPRAAQEVLTVQKLEEFRLHGAVTTLAKESDPQSAYRVLEGQARQFATKLGFAVEEGESVWNSFPPPFSDELALYEAVRGLSDHDLTGLQTLLTALSFGQEICERLDASDSLFNRVARDLSVDMRRHWRPDAAFFGKRNREQLLTIAKECGYADAASQLGTYKKPDLVNALVRYFQSAKAEIDPTAQQQRARDWLPEAMLFPAVDSSARAETEDEREPVDELPGGD